MYNLYDHVNFYPICPYYNIIIIIIIMNGLLYQKYWFCAISLPFTSIPAMTKLITAEYDSVECYHSNSELSNI